MTDILHTSYSVWKQVVQNNSFQVYFWEDGYQKGTLWAGNRDTVYETRVVADTWGDFEANFYDDVIEVGRRDDAIATIVGLENIRPKPVTSNNTPVTAHRELCLSQAKFLQTPDGYEELAMDASLSGSATVVWNGTADAGDDWELTGQGENSASAAHSGTDGLDSTTTSAGNQTKLDNGSELDIAANYSTLSFWMQPKAYPAGSDLQVLWKASGGSTKGTALSVADYVADFDLDVWQKVTIPIADFELGSNLVQKLHFKYASKGGQHFYFDDIELLDSGAANGPYTFSVTPDAYEAWHVGSICFVIATGDSGWSSTAFANIAGGLENGIIIRQYNPDAYESSPVRWSITIKDNTDLFGRFDAKNIIDFFDNEKMVTFKLEPEPASIRIDGNKRLDIVIKDDLSSLTRFRAFIHYGKEDLT